MDAPKKHDNFAALFVNILVIKDCVKIIGYILQAALRNDTNNLAIYFN